ncbi:hypothetical protein HDU79_000046 [Rhizoclosmatium sp. JEL0117]|nr:hypothetical protein HDU79_000046 [Rhizoclosmatium sp. JEL0117]
MTQGGFNRNYAVKEDIINPRAPTHQTPVNHLTGKSKESVIPVPPTPSLYPDEEYYEDEYPPGYFDQDDDDANNDANPTPQQVSPTKSTFSEGPSHTYPHVGDRTSRIREYEASRLRITEPQQQPIQQKAAAKPRKSPFQRLMEANSAAYKASSSFRTEYQREYHAYDQKLIFNGKPVNHLSTKPTALSPQPPLHTNLNEIRVTRQEEYDSNEEYADVASTVLTKRNGNAKLISGKGPFHKRNDQEYYSKHDIQLPIVDPPESVQVDYDEDLATYERRERPVGTMHLGSRVLTYNAEPPSTWNLANDLLLRAQRRQIQRESMGNAQY